MAIPIVTSKVVITYKKIRTWKFKKKATGKLKMDQPLFTAGGNVNWDSRYGKQCGGFSKIKSRATI